MGVLNHQIFVVVWWDWIFQYLVLFGEIQLFKTINNWLINQKIFSTIRLTKNLFSFSKIWPLYIWWDFIVEKLLISGKFRLMENHQHQIWWDSIKLSFDKTRLSKIMKCLIRINYRKSIDSLVRIDCRQFVNYLRRFGCWTPLYSMFENQDIFDKRLV